jgi:AcrR family transcriptional regulator
MTTASARSGSAGRKPARRSAAQSRDLIVTAARELFGQQGFANTKITDIAAKAGVSEIIVYRAFGTKVQLFEEVILGQVVDAIVDWLKDWSQRDVGEASTWESGYAYVEGVYRMVSANRGQILALLAAEAFEPAFAGERTASSPINQALQRIETLIGREVEAKKWHGVDVRLATRATFSMIFSLAMFPETLLPLGKERPGEEQVLREITAMMIYGVSQRPRGDITKHEL